MPNTTMEIGSVYSFASLAPGILPARFENMRLKAKTDFEDASKHQQLWLQYQNIFPALPQGTPASPQDSMYWHFISPSGERVILSEFWIDESSIELIENVKLRIEIPVTAQANAQRIRDFLNSIGVTGYTITQV